MTNSWELNERIIDNLKLHNNSKQKYYLSLITRVLIKKYFFVGPALKDPHQISDQPDHTVLGPFRFLISPDQIPSTRFVGDGVQSRRPPRLINQNSQMWNSTPNQFPSLHPVPDTRDGRPTHSFRHPETRDSLLVTGAAAIDFVGLGSTNPLLLGKRNFDPPELLKYLRFGSRTRFSKQRKLGRVKKWIGYLNPPLFDPPRYGPVQRRILVSEVIYPRLWFLQAEPCKQLDQNTVMGLSFGLMACNSTGGAKASRHHRVIAAPKNRLPICSKRILGNPFEIQKIMSRDSCPLSQCSSRLHPSWSWIPSPYTRKSDPKSRKTR